MPLPRAFFRRFERTAELFRPRQVTPLNGRSFSTDLRGLQELGGWSLAWGNQVQEYRKYSGTRLKNYLVGTKLAAKRYSACLLNDTGLALRGSCRRPSVDVLSPQDV
jgi:hypothetical protein